jgi:hypothetical protein
MTTAINSASTARKRWQPLRKLVEGANECSAWNITYQMTRKQVARGTEADQETKRRVRALVDEVGDRRAAILMGIGRATLARILGGLLLAPGTLALVREYFARAEERAS